MTREQNQLIKKIRNLSPEDVARVLQFLQQLKSPELRVVPTELRAVTNGLAQDQAAQAEAAGQPPKRRQPPRSRVTSPPAVGWSSPPHARGRPRADPARRGSRDDEPRG